MNHYQFVKIRTPKWVKAKDVRRIYDKCMRKGYHYNVDHIVPLRNPLVCGLHCPDNLRIIHRLDNLKKSNYFWPDMWMEQMRLF